MDLAVLETPMSPANQPIKKPRDDRSTKIDAWVLFMIETVVNWRRHTQDGDEKLNVAEYVSEAMRTHVADEYEAAASWMAQQTGKGPKPPEPPAKPKKK